MGPSPFNAMNDLMEPTPGWSPSRVPMDSLTHHLGWAQNVELMSADQERRRKADSARMVAEAMRQAGIGKDEPVALIGHSQGGIVAATLASDWAEEYTIEHVVTAGSPVANHPIPQRTWVTSVEIDDELVAALDGAANPVTDNLAHRTRACIARARGNTIHSAFGRLMHSRRNAHHRSDPI